MGSSFTFQHQSSSLVPTPVQLTHISTALSPPGTLHHMLRGEMLSLSSHPLHYRSMGESEADVEGGNPSENVTFAGSTNHHPQ